LAAHAKRQLGGGHHLGLSAPDVPGHRGDLFGRGTRRQVMALKAEGVDLLPGELGGDRRLVLQDKPE
jgi:hypothetical protein